MAEAKTYVEASPQHGKGVFAQRPLKAGESIITFTGPLLHRSQLDPNDYHLQVGEEHYLGASGAADDYVNHSCEPNAGFHGLVLVALCDIPAGKEITWDYSTAIDEPDFGGFPCACGAPACRGTVQSFRHLPPLVQARLRPWLLPYLKAKYFPG